MVVVATLWKCCLLSHVVSSQGYGASTVNAIDGSRRSAPSLIVHLKGRGAMIGRSAPSLLITNLLKEEKSPRAS